MAKKIEKAKPTPYESDENGLAVHMLLTAWDRISTELSMGYEKFVMCMISRYRWNPMYATTSLHIGVIFRDSRERTTAVEGLLSPVASHRGSQK